MDKTKRISIITFYNVFNFGAVLQAYALKTAINSIKDCNAEIVDYRNERLIRAFKLFDFSSIKNIVRSILFFPAAVIWKRKLICFINKYILKPDQKAYERNNIAEDKDTDIYIAGSDQIWRHELSYGDKTYFLDFVSDKKKKHSYAASFGQKDVFYENEDEFLELLSQFNEISLREPIGYEEISKNIKPPYIHIDPVLLLKAEEWRKLLPNQAEKSKYILIYDVICPRNLNDHSIKLSGSKKIKRLALITGLRVLKRNILRNKTCIASPQEFISYIANAEYVFTTSFHGVVFSILFRKKFFTELNCKNEYNHRVENLLNILGLRDRAIENFNGDFDKEIDWEQVEKKLDAERGKSFDYLKRITDM